MLAAPPLPLPLPQVQPLGDRTLVTLDAATAFFPRRTWLAPATMLLPRRFEGRAEVKASVLGDLQSGKVSAHMQRTGTAVPGGPRACTRTQLHKGL